MFNTNELIGMKFEHGGDGKNGKGIDCYNLCREAYSRMGKTLPQFEHPEAPALIQTQVLGGKELFTEVDHPEPYTIVMFRIMGIVSHVGLVLEDCERFIHVLKNSNVSIERLNSPIWNRRIVGYLKPIGD